MAKNACPTRARDMVQDSKLNLFGICAGEKYNKKNALHLKSQLRFRHMLGRSISLTDSLRKELERLIPTFAYVELAPEKMPSSEKTLSVLYETCKEVGPETGEDRAKYSNY